MRMLMQGVLPAVFILLLMACGQKGPLYLPKDLSPHWEVSQNNSQMERSAPATPELSP